MYKRQPSDHTVVIRAHGVPKAVYDKMNGREYIDLTCPFVAKIHKIVSKHHKEGYQICLLYTSQKTVKSNSVQQVLYLNL